MEETRVHSIDLMLIPDTNVVVTSTEAYEGTLQETVSYAQQRLFRMIPPSHIVNYTLCAAVDGIILS